MAECFVYGYSRFTWLRTMVGEEFGGDLGGDSVELGV